MAIPVARVHLKVAHAALPALLPTPPKWKMLLCPSVIFPMLPAAAKPSHRADADGRWDAHKTKSASNLEAKSSAASSSLRSTCADSVRRAAPPPPKPGRADSMERWDAHKKAALSASSSLSSSGTPSSSVTSSTSRAISRASSAERWDVHKNRRCPTQAELLNDDGESSSTGSNDIDTKEEEEEEEILWKPRAMYAGPGFVVAAPEPSLLPMPTTSFLVPVA